eukprot:TRINITY_DN16975_c0_g1_i1.p2 TRINITY_DN16975_c0_g1~~TRINITY_DN16975_c0_g1_i1.p2  ORF type:complete len:157 (-),score=27.41 TRINITY_DN16975_c0_g1_i1:31-501(-)
MAPFMLCALFHFQAFGSIIRREGQSNEYQSEVGFEGEAVLARINMTSDLDTDQCDESKCKEDGADDADCCALPHKAGCKDGLRTHLAENCGGHKRKVCCKPRPPACIVGACKENGNDDPDCCANPNKASCESGFGIRFEGFCGGNWAKNVCCHPIQ